MELGVDPVAGLRALAEVADGWGATWRADGRWRHDGDGGRLELPVVAGLRRGRVAGRLRVAAAGAGARVTFRVEESELHLQKTMVTVLVAAAGGAVVMFLAPFFPGLAPALPLSLLLLLGAWFFVLSRLKNSGPEELLETLVRRIEAASETGDPG